MSSPQAVWNHSQNGTQVLKAKASRKKGEDMHRFFSQLALDFMLAEAITKSLTQVQEETQT